MRKYLSFLSQLLTYLLSKIVCYVPRNKKKWAFGALGGFRDNPKYFFYDVVVNHREITAVWIAKNKKDLQFLKCQGMPVYYWLSLKGLWYALTAGVYIVDHTTSNVNAFFEAGSFYVNLWHGSSIKRVRWQNKNIFIKLYNLNNEAEMRSSLIFKIKTYQILFRTPDLCLAPSTIQLKDFFAPMMDIPERNCIVGVFPRSRLMIEGHDAAMDFIMTYEPQETQKFVEKIRLYNKTYVYMPTWRNDGRDFIKQAGIDWQRLNNVMKEKNNLIILKLHPFTTLDLESLSQYSNICLYPPNSDVYTVLPFIDCLITDYSSIYSDFLMMNKEIILFIFDFNEYNEGCCDLLDFDKYFVGKRAFNFNQLVDIIESSEDCHVPHEQYEFLMNFYWDNNQYNIDIAEEIKSRIGI